MKGNDAVSLAENKANSPPAAVKVPEQPRNGKGQFYFPRLLAWAVLIIALAATAGGWYVTRLNAELGARRQFDEEAGGVLSALRQRLLIYQHALYGAAGLFAASETVERAEWRAYLESVSVENRLPGVDGVGFIANVPRAGLEKFLRVTREDGAPEFGIHDEGTNAVLMVLKYLEPAERLRPLLGRDISGDAAQREVAEKARDTGNPVISGKIALLEPGKDDTAGFLMFLPVYRQGVRTETVAGRRANLEGWVFARFVGQQFLRGILENRSSSLDIEVYDGSRPEAANRLFDAEADAPAENAGYHPHFTDEITLSIAGRNWTVRFSSKPSFEATIPRALSTLFGLGGVVVSLSLFGIAWSLTSTRQRALAIAWDMTGALRQTNEQLQRVIVERQRAEQSTKDSQALYHALVESLPLNIVRKDLQGRITFANQRFCNEIGRSLKEILGRTDADLFSADLAREHTRHDNHVMETGDTLEGFEEIQNAAGDKRRVQVIKVATRDGEGNVTGMLAILWDVTDLRQTAEKR